jgi:hypothetical protein
LGNFAAAFPQLFAIAFPLVFKTANEDFQGLRGKLHQSSGAAINGMTVDTVGQ